MASSLRSGLLCCLVVTIVMFFAYSMMLANRISSRVKRRSSIVSFQQVQQRGEEDDTSTANSEMKRFESLSSPSNELSGEEEKTAETTITIVSWLASDWSNDGYEAMLANRKAYAHKHGYRFLDFNETNLPSDELRREWRQLSHYIKPPLLRAALDMISPNDWLVWMDADSLFTNDTIEWASMLYGDLVFAEAPDVISNNGVFAVRSTAWVRQILELWDEECAASPGPSVDNGPFVHALLRAFASTHNVPYNNECRANSWGTLVSCYNKHLQRIADASGLPRTIGPNGEIGSGLVGDPHITGAWGINSGIGFKPPNDWHDGDFILHFAGQNTNERNQNALKYTTLVQ